MTAIANARMYAISPEAEEAWATLLGHVADEAGVALTYEPYPAPQPLEILWRRRDLGAVFMCGYPIALGLADVSPLASPIPAAAWAEGQALYRSEFVVRAESRFHSLEETFGGTIGWTVDHSHSGFNAPRHHLLTRRRADGTPLFGRVVGNLVTARGIVDAVFDGRIDVGPLDAYWHLLLKRHRPDLAERLRVVDATAMAPLPALVASPDLPAEDAAALQRAFAVAA
jgi:ABC-type phosphate/phosphonate transport system substrate-binding protein